MAKLGERVAEFLVENRFATLVHANFEGGLINLKVVSSI